MRLMRLIAFTRETNLSLLHYTSFAPEGVETGILSFCSGLALSNQRTWESGS